MGRKEMIATQEISTGAKLAERYRILRRLGSGGMATVFLAEDERLGREVAIKRLHTDAPKASLRRFRNEARLGAALNHPGFVAIYDTLITDEGALIVMECVPGSSLAELAGGQRMRPGKALPILRSVAEALDHAHGEGVVHRDVKPGNILVRDDGGVKLADLGIARAIGSSQITSEGSVVGTLPYMAPERLEGPGMGGPEADVYALAAVAYELLSGRPPSHATSSEEAAAQPPPDLRRDWPRAPAAVASVLERGLDPDPTRRQPAAGVLIDELESALAGEAETEPAPTERAIPATALQRRAEAGRRTSSRDRGSGTSGLALGGRRGGAILGLVALAAALFLAIALAGDDSGPSELSSAGPDSGAESDPKQANQSKDEGTGSEGGGASTSSVDAMSPAALNDLGFSLTEQGRPEEAIPILERAVAAFPEDSQDLTYAYALFNLGHALRLAGRPEEAIPILQRRLEIPNQTHEVSQELARAVAAAGGEEFDGDEDDGPSNGNGKGKGKGHDKD